MIKKILLFIIPFVITLAVVIGYFKLTQKISTVSIPALPTVSFSDLVKFSRFSLEKAPSQSLVGTITSMNGEVEYEARLATESAKITSPVPVQQGESLSTGADGKVVLNFKDMADIAIDNNSGIDIIQTLPADLVFRQTLGSVEYIKLGTDPVSIRVGHLIVENMGDVKISFTADSPITTVVMISGSGTVAYNNLNNVSRVVNVSTGQTLKFNEGTRRVVLR
jgi:hypothetical protein